MRGKIEVYSNYATPEQEMVYDGPNTIVDGAGEVLADMMTAHCSLSAIPNLSSILDTSNYTIQAISFGKDASGYNRHAHELTANKGYGAINVNAQPVQRIVVIQTDPSVSSYQPSSAGNLLPSFVTPRQRQLEYDARTSGEITQANDGPFIKDLVAYSLGITDVGQNINTIPYAADLSAAYVADDSQGIYTAGLTQLFGCYAEGSGTGGTPFYGVSDEGGVQIGPSTNWTSAIIYQGTYNSLFNQVSSMDTSGFVNFVGSSTTDTKLAAGWSGLTVSADTAGADHLSSTGEIAYKCIIGSGDLGSANLYGGMYNLGLWTMDACEALKYNNPPFAFHPITNQKKYKLFSKKSLLDNACRTKDGTGPTSPGCFNHADLTLIWRLFFI